MKQIVLFIICLWSLSCGVYAQESSILVNGNTQIQKQEGFQQSLFVHETFFFNPFSDYQIIVEKDGDEVLGYRVGGKIFDENHSLFIQQDASEDKKTMQAWQEMQEGIYKKTILQEATYERIDGIYTPRQSVAATNYFRVIYNYDTTSGECAATIFSHDTAGIKNFEIIKNTWFHSEKYASFACVDKQSGCLCESDDPTCFIQNETIFTTPKTVGHDSIASADFKNSVGLTSTCDSSGKSKILYDMLSPDMSFSLNDVVQDTSLREYVSNEGVLYDGQQINEKQFYNTQNIISLRANSDTKMEFKLFDMYDSTLANQGVSGIKSYSLHVSKETDGIWTEIGKINQIFDDFNVNGTREQTDTQNIIGENISFLKNTFTKVGSYQIYISFQDAAANKARIIMHYNIIPGSIDSNNSYVRSLSKNTIFADNVSYYDYELYLIDAYNNPIHAKEIYNLEYNCEGINGCEYIRQNMLTNSPSGEIATQLFDNDSVSDNQGKISFKLKSFAPGILMESFTFEMFDWDDEYESIFNQSLKIHVLGAYNSFLNPFSGVLHSYVDNKWGKEIPISEETLFRLKVQKNISGILEYQIGDFTNFIKSQESESSFTLSGALDFNSDGNIYFSGSMDTTLSPTEYNKIGLEVSHNEISAVEISYVLSGKQIRYYLSDKGMYSYPIVLKKYVETQSNPVKIIGNLQGVGNSQDSFERQNVSDISSSSMRNALRKSITIATRGRQHDTIVNGIKYIDASQLPDNRYDLESNPNFETLVVHNGNIHITADFIPSGDMRGLISYIDTGYSVQNGYQNIGNIYIDNSVGEVYGAIYADGALISSDNGAPVIGNSLTRSGLLQNQLRIKGSLFTRNTLGGATLYDGGYILPGGNSTNEEQLALQYDLHHIRRGANNCIEESSSCLYNEYFIIEYDPSINSKTPVLFSQ